MLGHQEFILTYKTFEPVGPACLPSSAAPMRRVVAVEPT
jgi:altronate hydrolase